MSLIGLGVWVALRSRQVQVQPETFVFVKGDNDGHRWLVREVCGKRAFILRNAGSETGRWIDVKQLTKPPL